MTESPGVQIRAAQPDDAEALAHLHLDVWEDAYTGLMPPSVFADRRADVAARVTTWEEILSASGAAEDAATTWVAEDSDGLVGFVSVGPPRDNEMEHDEEVWALYVRASSWGTGLGHALLHTAVADRPAYLWVLASNARAVRFYQRQGFARDGAEDATDVGLHIRMVRA